MKKRLLIIILLPMLITSCWKQKHSENSNFVKDINKDTIIDATKEDIKFMLNLKDYHVPDSGFVPNRKTAINIAKTIWEPIYGDEDGYNGFCVTLIGDSLWLVKRNLNASYEEKDNAITLSFGGEPYILIRKKDAKIIKVTHTE